MSANPADTNTLKPGDVVRVRDPENFIVSFAAKIRDRDGVVEWVGPDAHGGYRGYATVRFGKRNGRGKEFTERMQIRSLVLQPAAASPKTAT